MTSSLDTKINEILAEFREEGNFTTTANQLKALFGYEEEKKTVEQRRIEFIKSIEPYVEKYGKEMCNQFYKHWSSKGERDRKMRFEKEGTWDLARRLEFWKRNQQKFSIANLAAKKLEKFAKTR